MKSKRSGIKLLFAMISLLGAGVALSSCGKQPAEEKNPHPHACPPPVCRDDPEGSAASAEAQALPPAGSGFWNTVCRDSSHPGSTAASWQQDILQYPCASNAAKVLRFPRISGSSRIVPSGRFRAADAEEPSPPDRPHDGL